MQHQFFVPCAQQQRPTLWHLSHLSHQETRFLKQIFKHFPGGDTNPLCGSGSPIPPPPLACMAFGGARGDAPSPNWDPSDHGFYPLNSYGAPLCPSKNKRCRTGSAAGRFGRESIRPQDYSSANQFGRHTGWAKLSDTTLHFCL